MQPQTFDIIISTPLYPLGITLSANQISKVEFLFNQQHVTETPINNFSQNIIDEVNQYFQNAKHIFNLPLSLIGTPFQLRVWNALCNIPNGTTVSYQTLADQLQTGARAIGNACRANPIPLIIPCHRVVAKNHFGGYAGATSGQLMDIKKWLLQHETNNL
jgi:methylated-DNA-[protein]-cysteine S-methyltransferase